MKTSEKIDQLLTDLFKVKSAILPLKKEAENPYFSSSYADLNTVLDGVEPILGANGFILLQPVSGRVVETILLHKSGQFISSDMELVLAKNDMQALGSAVSYARRYSLMSLLGLKAIDDDGNSATYDKAPANRSYTKAATTTKVTTAKANPAVIQGTVVANANDEGAPTKFVETTPAKPATTTAIKKFNKPTAKPVSNGTSGAAQFD
jgi:ERF superfamily